MLQGFIPPTQVFFCECSEFFKNSLFYRTHPQRALHVKSTWIRRGYYVETSKTKFWRISTSFPRTFFDVTLMVEKSTLFPSIFFDVISMFEKSTFFPHTFFDVIFMVKKSPCNHILFVCNFSCQNIHGVSIHALILLNLTLTVKKSTLFEHTFFDEISMNSMSFLISCKLMKTLEGVFLC